MSFDRLESSREHGKPINLYRFRYGPGPLAVIGYTSAEKPITLGNIVYNPIPVEANNIVASGTIDNKTLELRVPSSTEVGDFYRAYPPSHPITLQVLRGHEGHDDWLVFWSGRVLNGKHEGDGSHWCLLTCEPISTSLRRTGLRRHYQFMCPHVLYGSKCRANKTAATFTVVPAAVGGNTIGLDAGWAPDALIPKFANGIVEWLTVQGNLEIRTILDIQVPGDGADHTIHMTGPTTGLVGQSIRVTLGCNHAMDDCGGLHSNIHNFGGMPWIPLTNPVGTTNNIFW